MSENDQAGPAPPEMFPRKFIDELMRDFQIPREREGELMAFLRRAPEWYFATKNLPSKERQQIRVREGLECVSASVSAFRELIKSLSPLERDRLWQAQWDDPFRPPGLVGFATFQQPEEYPEETSFLNVLEGLAARLDRRIAELRHIVDTGGKPERTELRVFVGLACAFWTQALDRSFTYSDRTRHKRGNSFDFCWRVVRQIAPDVTEQALATAMRSGIRPVKATVRISNALCLGRTAESLNADLREFVDAMSVTIIVGQSPAPQQKPA